MQRLQPHPQDVLGPVDRPDGGRCDVRGGLPSLVFRLRYLPTPLGLHHRSGSRIPTSRSGRLSRPRADFCAPAERSTPTRWIAIARCRLRVEGLDAASPWSRAKRTSLPDGVGVLDMLAAPTTARLTRPPWRPRGAAAAAVHPGWALRPSRPRQDGADRAGCS